MRVSRAWRIALSILLLGCGNNAALGTAVLVTGDVIAIEDLVPVDGGVTITVTTQRGETERLLFPSLFTVPRPSQQTIDLYDVVRRVDVGDLIRAGGKRTTAGVELESLTIVAARQ